jgi:hypothetical protein
MKIILLIGALAMGIAFSACVKPNNSKDLHCLNASNNCLKDTTIFGVNNAGIAMNCLKMDGVNIRNIKSESKITLGDSVLINFDAIGINTGVTGRIMCATAWDSKQVEVNTFLEYNTCEISTDALTNVPCAYSFKPSQKGEYHFKFINIYGDFSNVSVSVE